MGETHCWVSYVARGGRFLDRGDGYAGSRRREGQWWVVLVAVVGLVSEKEEESRLGDDWCE